MFDPKPLPGRLTSSTWLVVAATVLCCGCQVASQGHNAQGARLYQQGNYQGASQHFLQAVANDPQNADGYYNLGATYHRLGKLRGQEADLTQAENFYNQCLDRDPNHTECYRGLAVLLTETGRSDAALRLVQGWVTRSPSLPDAKIELARLNDEFGDRESARQRLLEALTLEPHNSRALTALGKLREESGDQVQALADYERSLAVNRFQPDVATRVAALKSTVAISPMLTQPGGTRTVRQPAAWSRY